MTKDTSETEREEEEEDDDGIEPVSPKIFKSDRSCLEKEERPSISLFIHRFKMWKMTLFIGTILESEARADAHSETVAAKVFEGEE